MSVMKCKMCGGDLELVEGESVATCEYCGTAQTVPSADSEKKMTLFGRAGRLLRACEFDKAARVFESIVGEFPEEPEAYWGLVLCRYGIEYVDDPATGAKVPTCHRSSFESVLEDDDFEQALENADVLARRVYREEAKAIENLRQRIIEVSGKEEPYDIFICYKETDESGNRTIDSVMAQEVYDALTGKGYRVFFSRISFEDKLGTEYEPYIFAALNSAKVMLVIGTDYENFNAVWVKNEWGRFLSLKASGQEKVLIPCFKDLDPYDMPKEFSHLQSQDMGKVGAMQDLLRGIDKIFHREETLDKHQDLVHYAGPTESSLLERGYYELEDENWEKATELFDQVLNMDPKNAEAYLGVFMAKYKMPNKDTFAQLYLDSSDRFSYDKYLGRVRQNAGSGLSEWIKGLDDRWEREKSEEIAEENAKKEEIFERMGLIQRRLALTGGLISSGEYHTVGLNSDGTVVAIGRNAHDRCDVSHWSGIMAVSAGSCHTVGLRLDGTVVSAGSNYVGQRDLKDWVDIKAVSAGDVHTVGLRMDGTVVAVGDNHARECDVKGWTDITAVSAGSAHTVGLRTDGTVVAVGNNRNGECDVAGWSNIKAISAKDNVTVGLRFDGTVVAVGKNDFNRCDVANWADIAEISAGHGHTVGLHMDGTVVAIGNNDQGQCNVEDWADVVTISAGNGYTIGVHSDGTVVAAGDNGLDLSESVRSWKLFDSVDSLHDEAEMSRKRAIARLERERSNLQSKLNPLTQLIGGKKYQSIESRMKEVSDEIERLTNG